MSRPLPRDMLPYNVPVGTDRREIIARAMQHHFEMEIRCKKYPFHTVTKWDDLDDASKEEFLGYADAIEQAFSLTGAIS